MESSGEQSHSLSNEQRTAELSREVTVLQGRYAILRYIHDERRPETLLPFYRSNVSAFAPNTDIEAPEAVEKEAKKAFDADVARARQFLELNAGQPQEFFTSYFRGTRERIEELQSAVKEREQTAE